MANLQNTVIAGSLRLSSHGAGMVRTSANGTISSSPMTASDLPSHTHDDRYLPIGGGWYGSGLPGSRWGGYSVNGGEISFGRDLPNNGQMGILIDGCYIAGENNGFWSLTSDNSWGSRRGMYFDGTYLNFTTNSVTSRFSSIFTDGSIEADGRIYADNGLHVRGDWVRVNGTSGIYFESYAGGWHMTDSSYVRSYNNKSLHMNGASVDYVGSLYLEGSGVGTHLQPNSGSYGTLQITSTKNGWSGIRFTGSNVNLMMNSNESGFHNNDYGWQLFWSQGTAYIHRSTYGGGTQYTILDSGNYSSWAQPVSSALNTGNWASYAAPRAYVTDSYVDFYIYGDQNKYYPVTIHNWNGGHGMQRYSVSRGYSWTAPWDPIGTGAHQGGLTFTFEWSGDIAWGGNDKSIRIVQFAEEYTTMVAGMQLAHCEGVVVWLRGGGSGGAHYRLHGPGGRSQGYTINMSAWTSCAGVNYTIRDHSSDTVNSEIRSRFPIRGSGSGDIYVNNNVVATQAWVQAQGYRTTDSDNQTLSISGSTLSISGGNSVTIPSGGMSQATADSLYVNVSGDTMTGKLFTVSTGTGTYDTAIEIRETGYVGTGQSDWGYSPAMTFHWGGRYAKRFGMRSDGLFAVDGEPVVIQNGGTWGINVTGTANSETFATVTSRGASTSSQVSFTKTDDHAISVGTIRGRAVGSQGGEFIQLYERVNIGGPNGWGAPNTGAPTYGLSVFGGATIGYGNSAGLTVTGQTNLNGAVYINRHIDANTGWGNASGNTIFVGWHGGKVVLGNGNSGGHDYARDITEQSIVSTNPHYFYTTANFNSNVNINGGINQNNLVGRPYAVWGASSNSTGAVVIKFPGDVNNYGMVHAVIDVYEYNGNDVCTIIVGGHNWGSRWYSYGGQVIGNTNKPVRVGVKDGKYCIVIGDGSSSWSYGQVVLRKIQNGAYYSGAMSVSAGYTAAIESDSYSWISEDLRNFETPSNLYAGGTIYSGGNAVIHAGNIGSQSVNYASTVGINYNNDSNSTYQLLWGSGNSVYGTSQVYVNPSSDIIYARGGYISPGNPWGTSDSAYFPNGITTANARSWIYGDVYLGNAPSNGQGIDISSNGRIYVRANSAAAYHGFSGLFVDRNSASSNYVPWSFENEYGNHSWGLVARFHIQQSGADRPSIQFSSSSSNTRWSVGYVYPDDNFRITQNHGYRPDGSGNSDGWGTERFRINTDGNTLIFASLGIGGITPDVRLSVNGDAHVSNTLYLGGSAGSVNSWGTRTYGNSGDWTTNARTIRFDNVGYGSSWSFTIDSGGNAQSSASMRAPIFYDSNDTGYYLDPNDTSNLWRFSEGTLNRHSFNSRQVNSPWSTRASQGTLYQTGAMGWGQNDLNVIASNWGSGFFDTWSSPGNGPGASGHYVGVQAFHYNNSDSSRFHGWQMACAQEANNRWFWRSAWDTPRAWVEMIHSGNISSQSVSYASSAGSASSASTAGYASESYIVRSTNDYRHSNRSPDSWHGLANSWHFNDRDTVGMSGSDYWVSILTVVPWYGFASSHRQQQLGFGGAAGLYHRYANDGSSWSGWSRIYSDSYRPYADSAGNADTVDGYHESAFWRDNQNRTIGVLQFTGVGGDSGNGSQPTSYGIYQQGGSWSHPYPDLCIGYHTGIKIGAYYGYNGTRFYNNSDWATITASVNDGDNNFRGYYDVIAYASDKRLKENIEVIENALDKIMKLTGMTYTWNSVGNQYGWQPGTEREAGVFAQDVQAVLPEAVRLAPFDNDGGKSKSGENFLTVKYEKLVPLLIQAIKEQQKQIEELKSKLV